MKLSDYVLKFVADLGIKDLFLVTGGLRLPFKTVRWIAVTGESEKTFTKRGLDKSMTHQLNVGIAGLCGAEDSKVEYLFDVLGEEVTDLPTHHAALIEQARQTVRDMVQEH